MPDGVVMLSEPYRLAADVWGIGFKTADTIAASVGIARPPASFVPQPGWSTRWCGGSPGGGTCPSSGSSTIVATRQATATSPAHSSDTGAHTRLAEGIHSRKVTSMARSACSQGWPRGGGFPATGHDKNVITAPTAAPTPGAVR
jgi:Helix-hairpin-helix containing domain